jgi:ribose 5-phosphate isomerase A
VVPFSWESHLALLEELGGRPVLRVEDGGVAVKTDNGNLILDVHFQGGITDPASLERALLPRAGVVDTGLFLGMAAEAVLAGEGGIRVHSRAGEVDP